MFTRKLSFLPIVYPKARAMGITEFPYIERDSKGKDTYWEDSDVNWYKKEYDSNGNETYFENSVGYWERKEYDSNGNTTYIEDSRGKIIKK